jgi:hypothetical protein
MYGHTIAFELFPECKTAVRSDVTYGIFVLPIPAVCNVASNWGSHNLRALMQDIF